jgi:hypothetical protein
MQPLIILIVMAYLGLTLGLSMGTEKDLKNMKVAGRWKLETMSIVACTIFIASKSTVNF